MWHLRPWLKMLQNCCLHLSPEKHDEVNSIMVPFKPKYHLEINMPAKPLKWCFKMWGYRTKSLISNKVMQDLMMVQIAMFSNSHHRFLQRKTPRCSLKKINHCCHFNTCGREGEVLTWDHRDEQGTRLAYDGE